MGRLTNLLTVWVWRFDNRCDIMMYFEPDQKPLNDSHKYRENGVIKSEEE